MKEAINSAIILAVKLRKLDFVKYLVEKGADVNTKNKVSILYVKAFIALLLVSSLNILV